MNIQRFKNNEVRKLICELLGKNENEPIYVEELGKIERLNVNPRLFTKPILKVELGDLCLFKNLRELYLRDIYISDEEVQSINQAVALKYLQFNKCKFEKLNMPVYLKNLEGLSLVASYGINIKDFENLQNLKVLKIISSSIKNYKNLVKLKKLQEIYLQNLENVELVYLLKMNNLKLLNLDGSKVKKEKHEIILKERIEVSHASKFLLV